MFNFHHDETLAFHKKLCPLIIIFVYLLIDKNILVHYDLRKLSSLERGKGEKISI